MTGFSFLFGIVNIYTKVLNTSKTERFLLFNNEDNENHINI